MIKKTYRFFRFYIWKNYKYYIIDNASLYILKSYDEFYYYFEIFTNNFIKILFDYFIR